MTPLPSVVPPSGHSGPGQLSPGITLPPVPIIPSNVPIPASVPPAAGAPPAGTPAVRTGSPAATPANTQGTPPPAGATTTPGPQTPNKNSGSSSALDQAMAATLAAISIPTPPSKTGEFIT